MNTFFSAAGPAKEVTHGIAAFDLPILYFRDDAFALFYTADPQRVKGLTDIYGIVPPAEKPQAGSRKSLSSQTDTIYTGGKIASDFVKVNISRIRLKGNLRSRNKAHLAGKKIYNFGKKRGGEQ